MKVSFSTYNWLQLRFKIMTKPFIYNDRESGFEMTCYYCTYLLLPETPCC